jgi:hypothetical protein
MKKAEWIGGLAHWTDEKNAFISVVFSWKIPEAQRIAKYYHTRGFRVQVGGAILGIPQNARAFAGIAEIGQEINALPHHNPLATIASRGCPVGCWFCIVPKVEGNTFTLIPNFVPRPILCDSNLSALPIEYQNHIIQRYTETNTPLLDANSGFEPSTFDDDCYHRWKAINRGAWRFAFDETTESDAVKRMADILKSEPASKKRVYVLIGNEPIAQCYERVKKTIEWGCEPHCQAVLPLNAKRRDDYRILHDWNKLMLTDFVRWSNRWIWRKVELWDYSTRRGQKPIFAKRQLLCAQ